MSAQPESSRNIGRVVGNIATAGLYVAALASSGYLIHDAITTGNRAEGALVPLAFLGFLFAGGLLYRAVHRKEIRAEEESQDKAAVIYALNRDRTRGRLRR